MGHHLGRVRSWMRRAVVVVAVNLGLLAALLLGLETILRTGAPDLPVNGAQRDGIYTWGHRVVENRLGFRERDFEVPKPAGVARIMVLGDSLTWGAGLAPEERYTAILEHLLNAPGAAGGRSTKRLAEHLVAAGDDLPGDSAGHQRNPPRFEVLNFGVIGGPTVLERDLLLEHADAVDPDLIVVGFCLNDTQPRRQDHSPERERFESTTGRRIDALAGRLRRVGLGQVARVFREGTFRLAEMAGVIPHWHAALQRTYRRESREWRDFVQALADIRAVSDRLGLPAPVFTVLNQGTSTTESTDYADPDPELELFLRWYRQAEAAARGAGFFTINHEREIALHLHDRPLAVNVLDGHPSADLNRLYARKLHPIVADVLGTPVDPS